MTASVPGALNLTLAQLTSDMIAGLAGTNPQQMQATLGILAQYFSQSSLGMSNTAIATVGAGTLTAAAINGGVITRSGSTAAYTDTTATAAQIVAGMPAGRAVGSTFLLIIKNTVAFAQTLSGGSGVTLSGQTIIPPNSAGVFLVTISSATAVSILGLYVVPLTSSALLAATALTTVGAGTITAAGIAGGVTTRGGSQSGAAFTDTTGTAAQIIAARPNANIGESWEWTYRNNTDAVATLAGGTGVTVSGITIVPQNTWARFLVTYTAAATVTIVGIVAGQNVVLPPAKYSTGTAATFAAGSITGAYFVNYMNSGNNATLTTRTGTQMFGDIPNCQIGHTYMLAIRNEHATTATITAGDASVTLTGTMTIAQNVTRLFEVVFTSATQCTITSMGISAAGA